MAPWREYGRRHVHGIGLETAKGHAHIEGGYADHHLRITVQVGAQPAQHRRLETMEQGWDRNTARATLGRSLAVSAFPRYVPV